MSYNTIAQDTRPEWALVNDAIKLIGRTMRQEGISPEAMRVAFPNRPKTMSECAKVAAWVGIQIKAKTASVAPTQPSSPQGSRAVKEQVKSTMLNWDDITDGNYAFPYKGKTHFYRVSRREGKGKWAGRTFVNVQERASDELYRIDDRKRQTAILHSIREHGVTASHLLFSTEMGQCWHCLKSLTDETNPYKVHGLGPVCGPKVMG